MARNDTSDSASDSSKKVAKAARAGATTNPGAGERRDLGFPLAMAAIVFIGVVLIVFARQTRDVSALQPSFDDHWHAAYGIYDCTTESFLPDLADPQTRNDGIHTHGDGVVHIHPSSSAATGNNATIERFLEATRTDIRDDSEMTFPDFDALTEEGATCDGEPAILQIARFGPGESTPSEVITENLTDFAFEANQESITIALAPAGADIPAPPQENIDTAARDSGIILGTDGLDNLDLGNLDLGGSDNPTLGFDEDGNLVDGAGNIITPAEDLGSLGGDDTDDDSDGDDADTGSDDTEGDADDG